MKNIRIDDCVCARAYVRGYVSTFTSASIDIIELKTDFFFQKFLASKRNEKTE